MTDNERIVLHIIKEEIEKCERFYKSTESFASKNILARDRVILLNLYNRIEEIISASYREDNDEGINIENIGLVLRSERNIE
jgi:hypothetical protein